MILGNVEVPEDYWESTSTNNEEFEFIYNEKELSDIYIRIPKLIQITFKMGKSYSEFHLIR